jgi:hypothetical protein
LLAVLVEMAALMLLLLAVAVAVPQAQMGWVL